MRAFLWTMLVFYCLDVGGRLHTLAQPEMKMRTREGEALNGLCNTAVAIWAAVLLAQH